MAPEYLEAYRYLMEVGQRRLLVMAAGAPTFSECRSLEQD
jgi:hypothetical protein